MNIILVLFAPGAATAPGAAAVLAAPGAAAALAAPGTEVAFEKIFFEPKNGGRGLIILAVSTDLFHTRKYFLCLCAEFDGNLFSRPK